MTSQPFNAAALRGAVDLSALAQPPAGQGAPGGGATGAGGSTDGLVVDIDAQGFGTLVNASSRYPVVITLWAASQPASRGPVDQLAKAVRAQAGRVQLGVVDIDQAPEIAQAFQQLGQSAQLPAGTPMTTVAFLQGQPMPLPPIPSDEAATQLLEEVVKIAVSNGVAGRVPGDHDADADEGPADGSDGDVEAELPPLHQEAYDAIERGDLQAAADAFTRAVEADPTDADAKLGLGQVTLMQRTAGVDLAAARAKAADAPTDVAAQTMVADLDVLGGHVEDAFVRLIDLVRATSDEERNAAREHLLGLFEVVGSTDERVRKARSALTNALF
ncbi:co-chaperone YbbN [Segeticoccus rhizosphaerae]|jgi:putative thioredoxin|uniref:co-chaperone YbbN n=1 Tax=Segeticoccus rhizosphaerae TaxID=1104777 RepID=UPI0010C150A1|nr:tetratricopeptide repeat protein [Ornithinicoccus soli]